MPNPLLPRRLKEMLGGVTMYRLALYGTAFLAAWGIALAYVGVLPFDGTRALLAAILLVGVSHGAGKLLAGFFRVPPNVESSALTGLILFLIFSPPADARETAVLAFAAALAVASKYLIAVRGQHLFNPAAVAAVAVGLGWLGGATWWVGSAAMLPAVIVVSLLIVGKIRRFRLFSVFLGVATTAVTLVGMSNGQAFLPSVGDALLSWPLVFLGGVMLTEPLTMPSGKWLQVAYGAGVGLLVALPFRFGPLIGSPELALVLGNLAFFLAAPRRRAALILKSKQELAPDIHEFLFAPTRRLNFTPGQYVELTLPDERPDSRGNRRYFTVASAPSEDDVRLTMKIPREASSFKKTILDLPLGAKIFAGHPAGEFVLPKRPTKILALAGGVGITPFRSMIQEAQLAGQGIDMVLFYACNRPEEFVYRDVFAAAAPRGLKTVYACPDPQTAAEQGRMPLAVTPEMIREKAPDYADRLCYLSGPPGLVDTYKKLLRQMGVRRSRIITDYFSGY